jgi:hypothetical protein
MSYMNVVNGLHTLTKDPKLDRVHQFVVGMKPVNLVASGISFPAHM